MTTDVWQQARASVVALWRRVHPQQADTVEAGLEGLRGQVPDARKAGRADTEQALDWYVAGAAATRHAHHDG